LLSDMGTLRRDRVTADAEIGDVISQSLAASLTTSTATNADIFSAAFVACKLNPKTLFSVRNPLHGGHGHLELAITRSASSYFGQQLFR